MIKNLNNKSIERYSRQIILKNIGILGQKKLINSSVFVVGAGGLGCTVIDLLSRAGVGKIGIIDDDKISLSNIHRQSLYTTGDLKKYKVNVAKKVIKKINPKIKIKTFNNRLNENNIDKIIKNYEILIDGSDNFRTKFLLNTYSIKKRKKLIIGAISKFEGHVFSFDFKNYKSSCLKCFYQSIPSDDVLNCENDGIIGTVANTIGSIQANEAIKMILNIGKNLKSSILIFNILNLEFRKIKFNKKNICVCKK